MKIIGGYTNYGQDIGILMLDTRFPRIIGDIGNANTFRTHVRYRTVRNITKGPITEKNIEKELLFPFLEAAKSLEAEGCKAITTSCSFLAGYQQRLADAVHIPVFTSTLLLVPMLRAMLNRHSTIGIFTENPQVLNEEYFLQAGWSSKDILVAVTGMQADSPFSNLFIGDHVEEDLGTLKECVEQFEIQLIQKALNNTASAAHAGASGYRSDCAGVHESGAVYRADPEACRSSGLRAESAAGVH